MVGGDPVSVVGGGRGNSRAGSFLNSSSLSALGRAGGTLLGGLAALALLGEVGGDPDGVEEVDNSSKAGQEEKVEEDAKATNMISQLNWSQELVEEGWRCTFGGRRC